MTASPVKAFVFWVTVVLTLGILARSAPEAANAQSMGDLIGRFDAASLSGLVDQIESSDPAGMPIQTAIPDGVRGEMAKLVFQVSRLSGAVLQERIPRSASPPVAGDAVVVRGTIQGITMLDVPAEMVEFLEMRSFALIIIRRDGGDAPQGDGGAEGDADGDGDGDGDVIRVLTQSPPPRTEVGDRFDAIAVQMRSGRELWAAAGRGRFIPRQPSTPDLQVLSDFGVDVQRLPEIAALDRQTLSARDSGVFFAMIGAASRVAGANSPAVAAMIRQSSDVNAVELLRSPKQWTGRWITLDVETVRWTRVAIESANRQSEAGVEAYYQIDAIGDLGNVELQIKTDDGGLVEMRNRYPITLVSPTLPTFLRDRSGSADPASGVDQSAIAGNRSKMIRVHGFFYRLWSYESDFMDAQGGGKQFAPLLIAGSLVDQTPATQDAAGVSLIGKIAAIAVTLAVAATILFHVVTRRGDRRVKSARTAKTL